MSTSCPFGDDDYSDLPPSAGASEIDVRLHRAIKDGRSDTLRELLAAGAPLDIRDEEGMMPLHWAANCNNPECMAMLLSAGAPVNATEGRGLTPLHFSAERGGVQGVVNLIAAGASLDAQDNDGRTALHWATFGGEPTDAVYRYNDECVAALLSAGRGQTFKLRTAPPRSRSPRSMDTTTWSQYLRRMRALRRCLSRKRWHIHALRQW